MAQQTRPHLLLITTDQQRSDALGINGNGCIETPNLDALAASGANFSRGYVTCPVCIPARRTLLTGLSPDQHGLRHYQDGLEFNPPDTLPGLLARAGYQTQLVGKMHLHPQGKCYGFENIVLSETPNWRPTSDTQKRNDYVRWLRENGVMDHPHSHGIDGNGRLVSPWPMEARFHHNNWLATEARRYLVEDRDPSRPFFLHLSFTHPHPPLVPLDHYLQRYLAKSIEGPIIGSWAAADGPVPAGISATSAVGPFDPEIMRRAIAGYYALINHIDDCIAHVLETWLGYGSPHAHEPLYIMFSSDHGEMLGDHHLFRKSLGYEASAHVPFFLTGFNVPKQSSTHDDLVCWEDIAPTLLDLAGLEQPEWMHGVSLASALQGQSCPTREYIFGECGQGGHGYHNLWIVTDRWKYIWYPGTNEEQLFDLECDPRETTDCSGQTSDLQPMREHLANAIREREDLTFSTSKLQPCNGARPRVFWG